MNGSVSTTTVEELGENRVRLRVDVDPAQVQHAVEHAMSDLAESAKIPGFRKGKVPTQVLVSRLGKDRIYAEAVESHIGGWFWSAAARNRVRPVAEPEYEFELPANADDGWSFAATSSQRRSAHSRMSRSPCQERNAVNKKTFFINIILSAESPILQGLQQPYNFQNTSVFFCHRCIHYKTRGRPQQTLSLSRF